MSLDKNDINKMIQAGLKGATKKTNRVKKVSEGIKDESKGKLTKEARYIMGENDARYDQRLIAAARASHPGLILSEEGRAHLGLAITEPTAADKQAAFQAAWDAELAANREEALVTVEAAAPEQVAVPVAPVADARQGRPAFFYDGVYTVSSPKGGHRTYRIRTQALNAKFAPGEQVLSLLTGSDNENDYRGFAFIKADGRVNFWKVFRGTDTARAGAVLISLLTNDALGQKLAEAGYTVLESRHCYRCHRLLTTPESISRGIGPECATK